MENSHNYVQVLITTLQKQVQILQQVLDVTKEQSIIAGRVDFDEVMLEETLNQKEILIAELNNLDDGFTAVYGRVRNEIRGKQESYKDELLQMQDLIKQCTDLSVEIKVLEKRNREKMVQAFANQHQKYGSKRTAASVASRYHQTMNHTKVLDSYFLDKKN